VGTDYNYKIFGGIMSKQQFEVIKHNGVLPDAKTIDRSRIIEDLWSVYFDSTSSQLGDLEAAALRLETGESQKEDAASIRRILHSMKGEAGMCGVMDIYDLCHQAEFGFEQLPLESSVDMVLKVKDWIEMAIQHIQDVGIESAQENCQPKIKTLIIEDDYVCRKAIKHLLEGYCDCTSAADGVKALTLFEEAIETGQPYGLMTLDVQMPKMDGYETLKAVREFEKKKLIDDSAAIKVIIITALAEHNFGSLRSGFEAYLAKPVSVAIHEATKKLGLIKEQPQLAT
jgi:two-component system, chemotaxis family, chemotaxis protein CheY